MKTLSGAVNIFFSVLAVKFWVTLIFFQDKIEVLRSFKCNKSINTKENYHWHQDLTILRIKINRVQELTSLLQEITGDIELYMSINIGPGIS